MRNGTLFKWSEILWPWIFGLVVGALLSYFSGSSSFTTPVKDKLLDKLVDFCSIGIGFWSTALALLLALDSRQTVEGLKRLTSTVELWIFS